MNPFCQNYQATEVELDNLSKWNSSILFETWGLRVSDMCLLNRLPPKCQENMNVECASFRYPTSTSMQNTTTKPPHQLFGGFRLNMLFPSCSSSGKLRLLHLPVCSPNIFDGNPSRIDTKGSTNRVQGPSPLSYECSNLHPQASS